MDYTLIPEPLGPCSDEEIFVENDGILGVAGYHSGDNHRILAVWAKDEADSSSWLLSKLSDSEYLRITEGEELLRDAFCQKGREVYWLKVRFGTGRHSLDPEECPEGIDDMFLPDKNFRLTGL